MDPEPRVLYAFMSEIVRQYNMAVVCGDLVRQSVRLSGPLALDLTYVGIQGVLSAGAMISKALWMSPVGGADPDAETKNQRARARARALRDALNIKTEYVELRTVRNSFEHLDERMDGYLAAGTIYVNIGIGSVNSVIVGDPPALHLRRYDPQTTEIAVLDKSVLLTDLLDRMQSIATAAQAWLDQNPDASRSDRSTKHSQ